MKSLHRVIGVDESGKGDFFGPLVIAAFLADDNDSALLRAIGVRDGKQISDKKIIEIDRELRADYAHAVVVIEPAKYNKIYKEIKNLNKLLADGHADAMAQVLKKNDAELAISDKFGKSELVESALVRRKLSIELRQVVRGESIVQVAAASILARARFILEMQRLSDEFSFELPRGAAAHVDEAGRRIVALHGREVLERVGKTHFKNFHRIVNPTLF